MPCIVVFISLVDYLNYTHIKFNRVSTKSTDEDDTCTGYFICPTQSSVKYLSITGRPI